jgi:hypothetical protein
MDALILEINTRGLHRYEAVRSGTTTIGRALDNDIILSDPTVAPHHLQIVQQADESIELVNLTTINPTRFDRQTFDTQVIGKLPVALEIGRVQATLQSREQPVAATRPLAANRSHRHPFGHAYWALLLVLACLLVGGLDFFLSSYNSFKWGDLLKHLLRETIVTIGGFVLALSILERLLVNRWEIRQLLTSVCLIFLLYTSLMLLADSLDYLLSASWPSTLLYFGWYLVMVPVAIALYLIHISHMTRERSLVLALLIASPIAIPSILQSSQMQSLFDSYSRAASYHNKLSYLNWHLRERVDIERFIEQAKQLEPGAAAD